VRILRNQSIIKSKKVASNKPKANLYKVLPLAIFLAAQGVSYNLAAQTNTLDGNLTDISDSSGSIPSFPNPLSLNHLLESYSSLSPDIAMQQANIDLAKANLDGNQVTHRWQADITGRLGFREFAKKTQDHHLLALHAGKVLYDFERSANQIKSDERLVEQQKTLLQMAENKQRLSVINAFFNVLLADFQYRIDDEAMAVEYVGFDKVKDKHAIGQLSDVDLLFAEKNYQEALVKRVQAEQAQLQSRIQLANVIGLPDERPDELTFPKLKLFKTRVIKGVRLESLQDEVIAQSPQLQSLEHAQKSMLFALQSAKDISMPTVRADAWVGQLSSYPEVREGSWKATLSIDVPLYDGGSASAETAKAQAQLAKLKADKHQLELALKSQVADIYFQLKLLDAEKKQHQAFGDYADLYLDYSRALYENESSTDLGDAMVRLSQANYKMVAWEFKQALLWLQLDYLMGKTVSLTSSKGKPVTTSANSQQAFVKQ